MGAGGAGIASALLASLRHEEVTLLEAHSAIGGCASYFRRGQFVFDVGATTISGLGPGEPLDKLFSLLGSRPGLQLCDPGMVIHLSDGKKILYHHDFELWMQELHKHFPHLNHRRFWENLRKINQLGWEFLDSIETFPFVTLSQWIAVFKKPRLLKVLGGLMISLDMSLKTHGLDHPLYRELIDGILLISAQAESKNIPLLVGAMGLMYPAQTYAPVGGMKGLMDYFEGELSLKNVILKKKNKVTNFSELKADRLIFNISSWNLGELELAPLEKAQSWGAFTLYLGVKSTISQTYHQVHLGHPLVKNYFVSFSVVGDSLRAPEGWQTVSISTHIEVRDNYDGLRGKIQTLILNDFMNRFGITETKHLSTGTPQTFEFFTGRKNGYVGGLPFLYGRNPWRLKNFFLKQKETYRVGDTIFPGQGMCGVVAGALGLHRYLAKREA